MNWRILKNNFKQYANVILVTINNNKTTDHLLSIEDCPIKICSFEKNPEMKTIPISLVRLIVIEIVIKALILPEEINRASCWENLLWRSLPTTIKRFAFAKACIIIWKKQITGVPIAKAININPSCLNVERATTFLASVSIRAESLATKRVRTPKVPQIITLTRLLKLNRIINQTPAVTNVDLWTKDLTGVGAAIAAGNHLTKGHWALLVRVSTANRSTKRKLLLFSNSPTLKRRAPQKEIKRTASPNRLVKRVSNPPFALIQFW